MEMRTETINGVNFVYQQIIDKYGKEFWRLKNKWYMETDQNGVHKVIEQPNGIKIRLLREPSDAYRAKMQVRAEAAAITRAEEEEKSNIRKKIEDKKKQMAVDELLKTGGITPEELEKIGGGK